MNPDLYSTFVNINVGGMDFTPIPPQYLISFSYKRNYGDYGNTFNFSVYDEVALDLEYAIMSAPDRYVEFSYGYSGGARSKTFIGYITNYHLEFRDGGAMGISVEGISKAIIEAKGIPKYKVYEGKFIHEIVADVAKEEGWVAGRIEPTEKVKDKDSKGKEIHKKFIRQSETAMVFLNRLLLEAKSVKSKEGSYRIYFEDTVEGSILNFCTPNFGMETSKDYHFMYDRGQNEVINFSIDTEGTLFLYGAATLGYSNLDSLSNDLVEASYNTQSNPDAQRVGSKTAIDPNMAKRYYVSPALTANERDNRLNALWNKASQGMYGASLEVRGNPNLEVNSLVTVVLQNQRGQVHHTSGVYLVQGISDSISGGAYTSTLTLLKNSSNSGVASAGGTDLSNR